MIIKNSKLIHLKDQQIISYSLTYQNNNMNFLDNFLLSTKCSEITIPTSARIEEIFKLKWRGNYTFNLNFK